MLRAQANSLLILAMPVVLFAHFATSIPPHLIANLERTVRLFPGKRIVLLTDQRILQLPSSVEVVNIYNVPGWHALRESTTLPMEFRSGFWFTTFARLLAVAEFTISQEVATLHVESDVMIAPDFPFSAFAALDNPIAYPLVSPRCGVASTLYIRDGHSAKIFRDQILEYAKADGSLTDMTFLRKFYDNNMNMVSPLPIGPTVSSSLRHVLQKEYLNELAINVQTLKGYFDTVDLGFFLTGEDPRNHRGFRLLRTEDYESTLKVTNLIFNWDKDRSFPSMAPESTDLFLPVYSLHIHSKDIRAFNNANFLRRRVEDFGKPSAREFNLFIFFSMSKGYLVRRLKRVTSYFGRISD